jgi:molybdopterin converting factor small subunit
MGMKIEVRLYGTYKDAAGIGIINEDLAEGTTLGELLKLLAERYGDAFQDLTDAESGGLIIHAGDVTRDLNEKLKEGASVVLVPAMLGG